MLVSFCGTHEIVSPSVANSFLNAVCVPLPFRMHNIFPIILTYIYYIVRIKIFLDFWLSPSFQPSCHTTSAKLKKKKINKCGSSPGIKCF